MYPEISNFFPSLAEQESGLGSVGCIDACILEPQITAKRSRKALPMGTATYRSVVNVTGPPPATSTDGLKQ